MRRRNSFLRRILSLLSIETVLTVGAIIFFIGSGSILLWLMTLQIPDFKNLAERRISQSTKIYDRTGKVLLYDIHQNITRKVIPAGDISPYLKKATIAIEDNNFYNHNGIELWSVIRATFVNLGSGSLKQGASTITQQVIKNALLTPEKRFSRKIKEIILAFKLERAMTKEEILALYLNEIPYGGSVYGAEDASLKYFGKNAKSITLAESAYLAAIIKAPTYYSPYGKNKNKLEERKNLVLDKMMALKFISKEEGNRAKKEKVVFLIRDDGGIKAPHFVEYVKSILEDKHGREYVETRGLKVITTLDWELQKKAEAILRKHAEENEKKFNAKNAGMIGIDPKTGEVLVMVGSRDYFDIKNDGNFNVTTAKRQPGSAFKPFVYATAFNKGYTGETVLFDLETQFETTCTLEGKPISQKTNNGEEENKCYIPGNYDSKFRGPISLREALAQSINIPAIKLLYLVGIKDTIQTAKNMGIASLNEPERYGLTLVLGGGEVSLLDITGAYSVFANNGKRNNIKFIEYVEDENSNKIEDTSPDKESVVLPENTALLINSILSDHKARIPIFGENSPLEVPGRDVAAKTGTTNDYRDAWVIGYSPNFALGVWVGNNDNSPMEKKVAGYIAAPMWNEFFKEAITPLPVEKFKKIVINNQGLKPIFKGLWQGGKAYEIDKMSKKLATDQTPKELVETKVVKEIHSILYWIDKNDPHGKVPQKPEDDPQFVYWETPIRKWVRDNKIKEEDIDVIPKETDDVHLEEFAPKITILSPIDGQKHTPEERIYIKLGVSSKFGVSQADFFLNNSYLGSSKSQPFDFSFTPKETQNISQDNIIKVVVYDAVQNKSEATIRLKLSI